VTAHKPMEPVAYRRREPNWGGVREWTEDRKIASEPGWQSVFTADQIREAVERVAQDYPGTLALRALLHELGLEP
jgi:hypothetical protein